MNNFWVCIDASIALRLVIGGPYQAEVVAKWEEWLHQGIELVTPALFRYEVTNVIWREAHARLLSLDQALNALRFVLDMDIHYVSDNRHHVNAMRIAKKLKLPSAYDAHYLAVAEDKEMELWTLDQKLYKAAAGKMANVRLIPSGKEG